jgi:hypothetical protein
MDVHATVEDGAHLAELKAYSDVLREVDPGTAVSGLGGGMALLAEDLESVLRAGVLGRVLPIRTPISAVAAPRMQSRSRISRSTRSTRPRLRNSKRIAA